VGSGLIGQNFTKQEYFHPRPSAASSGYEVGASSGSKPGPTNLVLADRLAKDAAQFRKDSPEFTCAIPAGAITNSGAGLDPEISPANALAQSARVAAARGVSIEVVRRLVNGAIEINGAIEKRDPGFPGEPRVNVLRLNIAPDEKVPVTR
jgi:K+-transporting ATPase ATPase C chain